MFKVLPLLLGLFLSSCGDIGGTGASTIAPLVSLRTTSFGSGTLSIEGAVELPSNSVEGSNIRLYISRSAGTGGGSQEKIGSVTTAAHEIRYSITGLPSGDYQVLVQVDENGNGIYSNTGDFEGWYSGTVNAPVQNQSLAATIIIASVSRFNMNFGIGLVP